MRGLERLIDRRPDHAHLADIALLQRGRRGARSLIRCGLGFGSDGSGGRGRTGRRRRGRFRNDIAAHDLGLFVLIACERNVALDLSEVQIAAQVLLDEMGELEVAAHCDVDAVIGSEPLNLPGHIGSVGAVTSAFVAEPGPGLDIPGAVDERLLAVHIVELLGILILRRAAHDGETHPIDCDIGGAELLDEGFDPLTVDLAPTLAANLQPLLAAANALGVAGAEHDDGDLVGVFFEQFRELLVPVVGIGARKSAIGLRVLDEFEGLVLLEGAIKAGPQTRRPANRRARRRGSGRHWGTG